MSAGPSRIHTKRGPDIEDGSQEWENHIILRVPPECAERVDKIVNDESKEDLGILFTSSDMREAQIKIGNQILNGRVHDLPCINEVYKTLDKKNIFKVADVSQIMVCTKELQRPVFDPNDPKSVKKELKQFQWPHGMTPPMKSARRRRFRKTKKKKYMDAPEVEKELKRLLRADLEADSVKWEIIEDNKKELPEVNDTNLFGAISSSGEEDEGNDE